MRFVIKQFTMFGRAKIGSKTGQYPRGDPRGCTAKLLDFSGLVGFCPPFRPPVTPELIQTDHLRPPPPKSRNPLPRPALRDGVTGWRGACDPLPLSCTKIDRLLHPNILVWESQTLGAHSPHTAPCNLGGTCALPAPPSPHTTHHRPHSGVVMRSAPCPMERTPRRTSPLAAALAVELLPAPAQTAAALDRERSRFGSAGWCTGDSRCA